MSLLAIIPARGKSKRLKKKNIKVLMNKPLIAWTIRAAKASKKIDKVVVSTEDNSIAKISKKYGAEIPFMRPMRLSKDNVSGVEPAIHAIKKLKGYDWLLLLQPTSPLRKTKDIDGIIEFCKKKKAHSAVSLSKIQKKNEWKYILNKDKTILPYKKCSKTKRLNKKDIYSLNGALYLIKIQWLLKKKNFIDQNTLGYVMPNSRSIDIDTIEDWNKLKNYLKKKKDIL